MAHNDVDDDFEMLNPPLAPASTGDEVFGILLLFIVCLIAILAFVGVI
mgnify:CR=1 FL=1